MLFRSEKSMRDRIKPLLWAAAVSVPLCSSTAHAQAPDPKFVYIAPPPEVEKVIWKASAQAGLILATGNANTVTISGGAAASRVDSKNKLALDVNAAYGQATSYVAQDRPDVGVVGKIDGPEEIGTDTKTNTQMWNVKLRYDRFFSKNNLGYVSLAIGGNEPAGKQVYGGAQVGYSRQLVKTDRNELLAEVGYDFTFELYPTVVPNPPPDPDRLMIHSLRVFVGHNLTLSKETALITGLEGLFNVNPLNAPGIPEEVSPFRDTRVNFKTALSTTIYKNLSFRFSFTARFDNVPAPRPALALPYAAGFTPLAEKLDTLSEAALVVNFL